MGSTDVAVNVGDPQAPHASKLVATVSAFLTAGFAM
jgi:hypothetical protein